MMTSSLPSLTAPEAVSIAEADALRGLMLQLSQMHRRQLAATLSACGLTLPQYSVLKALGRADPARGCTMTELAEATHQVAATMTGIIDRLAERELVERRQDSDDRRAWRVLLTGPGASLMESVEDQQRARTAALLASFSVDDRGALLRLLGHYLDAMQRLDLD